MRVKLFGNRCLVEFHRPKTVSKILIPDSAMNRDSHRMGIVRFIGDGLQKGKEESIPSLVKEGDVVVFQINSIMEATQKFVLEGKTYMNLLQDDLLMRVHGEDVSVDNLEMLGDYLLVKHFVRQQPGSTLFLPDTVVRQSAPDFIYFRCVQKGSRVTREFSVGSELVLNFGRLTPMFIVKRNADETSENQEFAYTRQEWVDGVVQTDDGSDTLQA